MNPLAGRPVPERFAHLLRQSLRAAWFHIRRGATYKQLTHNLPWLTARSCLHTARAHLTVAPQTARRCLHKAYEKLTGATQAAELLTQSLRKAYLGSAQGAELRTHSLRKAYLGSTPGRQLLTHSLREASNAHRPPFRPCTWRASAKKGAKTPSLNALKNSKFVLKTVFRKEIAELTEKLERRDVELLSTPFDF